LLGKGANGTANNNTAPMGNSGLVLSPEALESSNIAVLLVAQRNQKQQNGFDPALDFGSVQTVTTLRVSNELCGVIIGMGGRNIRYIKQVSGAQIDFKKCDDNEDRVLTMHGTQDQIQVAEQLMAQCVKADKRNGQRQQQQPRQQQQRRR
jgi:transcription antitermination factor NusA-like protein